MSVCEEDVAVREEPLNDQDILNIKEVSAITKIPVSTLWRRVKRPDFPLPLLVDGHCRWSRPSILAWMEERVARGVIDGRRHAQKHWWGEMPQAPSKLLTIPDKTKVHTTKSAQRSHPKRA